MIARKKSNHKRIIDRVETYGFQKILNPKSFKHFYYFLWPIAEIPNFWATEANSPYWTITPPSLSLSFSLCLKRKHVYNLFRISSLSLWHFYLFVVVVVLVFNNLLKMNSSFTTLFIHSVSNLYFVNVQLNSKAQRWTDTHTHTIWDNIIFEMPKKKCTIFFSMEILL